VAEAPSGFKRLDAAGAGLLFTNTLPDEMGATNRTLYNGSGLAAGDVDGDGLPDLVLAGIENRLEFFRNLGNWRFTDATREWGLQITNLRCRGVVLADIDGDGRRDLLLSANGIGVKCWRNDGGKFTEITAMAGTASTYGSLTLALADVDGNGTIDLYVANNRADDIRDTGQVRLRSVGGRTVVPPALTNRFVFKEGQLLEYGEPDVLLLNDGSGRFRSAGWTNGTFLDEAGRNLPAAPLDWALTASFRDVNGDGAPDLYVCNDFWTEDRLWINDGAGRFRAAPWDALRQISGSSMGVDMADLNADGRPEIFVVDMLSRLPSWRKRQMAAQPRLLNLPGVITNRPQSLRNTLFVAREDGTYAEAANFAGLAASEWAWQPFFFDVDLDGQQDLLITSGHARDVQDRDAEAQVRTRQRNYGAITNAVERQRIFSQDLLANMRIYPPLQSPIVAFRNLGGMKFADVTEQWGTSQPGVYHGLATADFDGDGDLDLALNPMNGPAMLYRNEAAAPRLAIRLRGLPPNTEAIGAKVILRGGAVPEQTREVISGGRYLSSGDPLLVFAAGSADREMELEIRWRGGRRQIFGKARANRVYEIMESATAAPAMPLASPPAVPPLFEDASAKLGHRHQDELADDFARQPTLPLRLSQSGPSVAWTDLDGDGWDDLAIGAGRGGALGVFRNDQRGGFGAWTNGPFQRRLPRDTAALLGVPGADGRPSIIAALSSYEDGLTNSAALMLFEQSAEGPAALLPDRPSSLGPLALADFDADDDLDLFAGARVTPARWPEATGSVLLRHQAGTWPPDQAAAKLFESGLGVSAAVWSDLEADGYPELILAGEWSGPRVFRNQKGVLAAWDPDVERSGQRAPLSECTGLWSSATAGDFDNDGRMDLALGNWGENGEWQAATVRPLTLLAGAFAENASLTVLETVFDPERKALTAARPLEELALGLPFLAGKFSSHRQFARATADELLGDRKNSSRAYSATTLRSGILLNRGDHFVWRPLPMEAQLAPVFGLAVADFDLDGNLDLFLAQNFFATRPGLPRLDAGRGLLLTGDGQGGFQAMDGSASGIKIYGEQRAAAVADFDRDRRPDLLVAQNAAETKLFRNQSPRAGLAVRLQGPRGNPQGIGATLRLRADGPAFPAREIHAGAGYWSQDSPTVLLALPQPHPSNLQLEIRWPGGALQSVQVPEGSTELLVKLAQ